MVTDALIRMENITSLVWRLMTKDKSVKELHLIQGIYRKIEIAQLKSVQWL